MAKIKEYTDDILNFDKMATSVFDSVENIVGKRGKEKMLVTSISFFSKNVFIELLSLDC